MNKTEDESKSNLFHYHQLHKKMFFSAIPAPMRPILLFMGVLMDFTWVWWFYDFYKKKPPIVDGLFYKIICW